jgi:hypothetical protein
VKYVIVRPANAQLREFGYGYVLCEESNSRKELERIAGQGAMVMPTRLVKKLKEKCIRQEDF